MNSKSYYNQESSMREMQQEAKKDAEKMEFTQTQLNVLKREVTLSPKPVKQSQMPPFEQVGSNHSSF